MRVPGVYHFHIIAMRKKIDRPSPVRSDFFEYALVLSCHSRRRVFTSTVSFYGLSRTVNSCFFRRSFNVVAVRVFKSRAFNGFEI